MKRTFLLSTWLCVFSLVFLFPDDTGSNTFSMTNYGIMTNDDESVVTTNKDNVTGKINITSSEERVFTVAETIHAALGTNFGIEFVCENVNGDKPVRIIYRYHHPKITNPHTKKSSTVDSLPCEITPNEKHVMGWKFNEDWEVVTGKWTLQIIENNKVVIEKVFIIE